ncbi:MAG: Gfo/Idh/MocA family oxidoreductase [Verrucomicrobia bacterium]|nr:Gfo/Idh/MocA family oxidoreductase [Verrucomicrobiota bacterium]
MNQQNTSVAPSSRREFLKTSTTAVAAGALVSELGFPAVVSAAPNSDKLRIGLIGSGGRGSGAAANALNADSNTVLHAVGDIYASQIQRSLGGIRGEIKNDSRIDVPTERQFVGLDSFEKVIKSDVDIVILTTPPGFRPLHFKRAIEAGKHVFLEKPVATDASGVRSVRETAKLAQQKGLAVQSGFVWRANTARREFYKRIHGGDIGEVRAVYATYLTGPVKPMPAKDSRPAGMSDTEWQVKNWYNFVWLSGDGLVEQAIHSVDKVAWAMKDELPLKCTAVGGRMIPNNEGNIWDHIEVNFEWASGARAFVAQRQITGCHSETRDYIMGERGQGLLGHRGGTEITGPNAWRFKGELNENQMLGKAYETEHVECFESIRRGKPVNDGEHMCNSTLLGLMGRMAGYTGQEVTWEHMLKSEEKLCPVDLDKLDWNAPLPFSPMALPGRTKLV